MKRRAVPLNYCRCILPLVVFFPIFIAQAASAEEQVQHASWQFLGPEGGQIRAFVQDPFDGNNLYAALSVRPGNYKIFKTTDKGNNWSEISQIDDYIPSLAVDPRSPSVLYAGSDHGVYKSTDGGRTWQRHSLSRISAINDICVDPNNSDIIHACTLSNDSYLTYCKSVDGGLTWSQLHITTPGFGYSVAVDPSNSNTVYVGGLSFGESPSRLFKSTDGGSSFTDITQIIMGDINDIVIDPSSPNHVYVATECGIYRSSDYGLSWSKNNGIAYGYKLALHPQQPNRLYAGWDNQTYFSSDGGVHWNSFSNGLCGGRCYGICVDSDSQNIVYFASTGGFFKSVSSGTDWAASNTGMLTADITALKLAPSSPTTLYIAYQFNALYKTTDALTKKAPHAMPAWTRLPEFGSCRIVSDILVCPQDADIVYALEGYG